MSPPVTLYCCIRKIRRLRNRDKTRGRNKARVVTADAQTGVVTLDDQIFDTYLVSDAAKIAKISLLEQHRALRFFGHEATALSSSNLGLTYFRFNHNLQLQRLEAHDAYGVGIGSCRWSIRAFPIATSMTFATCSKPAPISAMGSSSVPRRKISA